ncbi:MAG: hypothetical protein ACLTCI_06515 [[Clostridium] nexile]
MFYQVIITLYGACKSGSCLSQLGYKGEIGASFAYTPSYALDCKPINAMAKAIMMI